jgi:hypothetical protein
LLQQGEGEVESFLVNKTTGIDGEEVKRLSKDVGQITREDAEAIGSFIAEEVNKIVSSLEKP